MLNNSKLRWTHSWDVAQWDDVWLPRRRPRFNSRVSPNYNILTIILLTWTWNILYCVVYSISSLFRKKNNVIIRSTALQTAQSVLHCIVTTCLRQTSQYCLQVDMLQIQYIFFKKTVYLKEFINVNRMFFFGKENKYCKLHNTIYFLFMLAKLW